MAGPVSGGCLVTYPEPTVSRVMGPKKLLLVTTRRLSLKKERDWLLVDGVVNYTGEGLALLCEKLGVELAPLQEAIAKNLAERAPRPPLESPAEASASSPGAAPQTVPAQQEGALHAAIVTKPPASEAVPPPASGTVDVLVTGRSPNPLVVFGQLDGQPVKVKVRDNAAFTAGLVIRAKPSSQAGVLLMVGNPPRWRGDKVGFTRTPAAPANPTS